MSDRMEDEEFMRYAHDLGNGRSTRAPHCNNNRTMIVSRDGVKVTARCFRCDAWGLHEERESLADKIRRHKEEEAADREAQQSFVPPEPRVYDMTEWPVDAALWLWKMGMTQSRTSEFGAWWCPTTKRVVLPVSQNGQVVFWQGRSIKRKPKIISPMMPRRGLVARYGSPSSELVLCEDALSAYKVGLVNEAWGLLGTKLLDAPFAELLKLNKPVVTWLDSDGPGQSSAAKIRAKLRGYGIPVRNVVSEKDPKHYPVDELRRYLCR